MWNDISQLRLLGIWLQWLAISLVFIGGFLQVAKFVVDRREKELVALDAQERQKPNRQIISSGTATIDLIVDSSDPINTHFMDSGAYLAFGRGGEALMVLRSLDSFASQRGNNEVNWRGILALDSHDASIGKAIGMLAETEYLQLGFGQLKSGSIKRGSVVLTINGVHRFVIDVPTQAMDSDRIFVRNFANFRSELK